MVELRPEVARSVALAVLVLGTACESSAPASTAPPGRPVTHARDWTGSHVTPAGASAPRPPEVPRGTWVLHIGDSFVHASLQQNLRARFEASGASYVVDATTATYTTTWANDPQLDLWLARRPSLVLVTLGANEVDMPVPAEHAAAVEQLVRKIAEASTSCVWITPPMWKQDTGILQVIHDHRGPCLFLDSDAVLGGLRADERQPDRIHPNKRGGLRWSEAVWSWLVEHKDPARPGWALVPFERRPG
ncbi:MAG: SGNH/GDSL hydrolase family protein [Polyangiaceae bacterium]